MGGACVEGQTANESSGIGVPIRRAKPSECRNEIDARTCFGLRRNGASLRNIFVEAKPVAQPFEHRSGRKNRAFHRIGGVSGRLVAESRKNAFCRGLRLVASVEQKKQTRAVGCLSHSWVKAGLADEGRVLVACHACNRNLRVKLSRRRNAVHKTTLMSIREERLGYFEQTQKIFIPAKPVNVEQHGTRGVCGICCM